MIYYIKSTNLVFYNAILIIAISSHIYYIFDLYHYIKDISTTLNTDYSPIYSYSCRTAEKAVVTFMSLELDGTPIQLTNTVKPI